MIQEIWQYSSPNKIPDWLKDQSEIRRGNGKLYVFTMQGEVPAELGDWISIDLRGHLFVTKEKPKRHRGFFSGLINRFL